MSERAQQLQATSDGQIADLIGLISRLDEITLRRPCPGREKLGDGTVGACARHAADNYRQIATFVNASDQVSAPQDQAHPGARQAPRLLRALGQSRADRAAHDPGAGQHDDGYTADNVDLGTLVKQLSAARDTLGRIAELSDCRLDAIAPKGSFRFCDGQRTLEQVLASLLKHQGHQVDALKTAVS